jgi:hypothetical protein
MTQDLQQVLFCMPQTSSGCAAQGGGNNGAEH